MEKAIDKTMKHNMSNNPAIMIFVNPCNFDFSIFYFL